MSRRRVAVLLAIMAALAGAPSSVSAAPPNQLSQAHVTPTSGGPSTVFVVTVRYRSAAGKPASALNVNAGDHVTAMKLVSGTSTNGLWMGTATLPPGDWDITVEASVAKGSKPSLLAGTVSVAGATAVPHPTGGETPSTAAGPGGVGGGPSTSPASQPMATAAPTTGVTPAPAPARSSSAAAPSQPPSVPAQGVAAPVGSGGSGEAPVRSPRANPTVSSEGAQRSLAASPSGSGTTPAPNGGSDDLGLFMLVGTLAFGMVALVGSAWLFLAVWRDRRAATATAESASDPGVAVAIVEQRARRRARLRSTDDPILAAMGLPEDDATPRATPPPHVKSRRNSSRRTPKR